MRTGVSRETLRPRAAVPLAAAIGGWGVEEASPRPGMFHVKRNRAPASAEIVRGRQASGRGGIRWRWALPLALCACAPPPPAPSERDPLTTSLPSQVSARAAPAPPPPVASASAAAEAARAPLPRRLVVHVVPLGPVSQETLRALERGLRDHANLEPRLHAVIPLAAGRKAKRPGRYLAVAILDLLAATPGTEEGKVLGVTEVDIVAEKDGNPEWGVLGLGSIDGKACVLSTFRMRRTWERGGAPEEVVRSRLWKTAIHEVGHTLGLEHCPVRGCIMEDGHGTVATTDGETALCPACTERYGRAIGK